jgi:hypothetical protein
MSRIGSVTGAANRGGGHSASDKEGKMQDWMIFAIGIAVVVLVVPTTINFQIVRVEEELRKIRKLLEYQCSQPEYEFQQTMMKVLKSIENTLLLDGMKRRFGAEKGE